MPGACAQWSLVCRTLACAGSLSAVHIEIRVTDAIRVSGELDAPAGSDGIVLGHGAGNDMTNPLLVAFAAGLRERGYTTLRFNFPYTERKRKVPDPKPVLLDTYRAACVALRERAPVRRLCIGGKSMGGRISSLLAAEGFPCDGLVFLGYPLHPPGKPEQLRDAHLTSIRAPMLFLQGTRDPLCRLDLLGPVLERLGQRATLHIVDGADHSFSVPKKAARSPQQVVDELVDVTAGWLGERLSGNVAGL